MNKPKKRRWRQIAQRLKEQAKRGDKVAARMLPKARAIYDKARGKQ